MKTIQTKITNNQGEIELTLWEADLDKMITTGDTVRFFDKKLLVNISFKKEYLGKIIEELETIANQMEEKGIYDGSGQQAEDYIRNEFMAHRFDHE